MARVSTSHQSGAFTTRFQLNQRVDLGGRRVPRGGTRYAAVDAGSMKIKVAQRAMALKPNGIQTGGAASRRAKTIGGAPVTVLPRDVSSGSSLSALPG